MTSVIGIDIGGANIKLSDGVSSRSQSFPMWKTPELLCEVLHGLLEAYPAARAIAVTMTGELADCFQTKREGVHFILNAVQQSAGNREIAIWQTGGEFFTIEEAREFPSLVAAANWHALATWAGRMAPQGMSLVIDIGSTTTDIIPIQNGIPLPAGLTDFERLQSRELIYLGAKRTPLCAVANEVRIENTVYPLARELFATTYDLALITGNLQENQRCCDTANGMPATIEMACNRLARMFCTDLDELSETFLRQAACALMGEQIKLIADGIRKVFADSQANTIDATKRFHTILISGEGEFLANLALQQIPDASSPTTLLSLSETCNPQLSIAACAYALSILGCERL